MIRYIGSLLCVLALATLAVGSNCVVQRVVVRQQYVAPVIAHDYYQPYSIGYTPAGELAEAVKLLIEDNRAMREQLIQALKAGKPGELLPIKATHPGELVMANRCATCHDETTAKAKGGGKVYFRGGAFLDTPENVNAVIGAAIEDGSMPKGGKLTAEEKLDLMRRLVVSTGK